MSYRRFIPGLLLVLSPLLIATTCPSKVTGGGSIDGNAGRATIAFNGDSCGATPKGELQYVDHDSGVKFHGTVTDVNQCGVQADGSSNCVCHDLNPAFGLGASDIEIDGFYRSTNPSTEGGGSFVACVSDNGEGSKKSAADAALIYVVDGPYAGYTNSGTVQGNVQMHKCPGKTTGP